MKKTLIIHVLFVAAIAVAFMVSRTVYAGAEVSCYAAPTQTEVGEWVRWRVTMPGEESDYQFLWSGTDGLEGRGKDLAYVYRTSGPKRATVTYISRFGTSGEVECSPGVFIEKTYAERTEPQPLKPVTIKKPAYNTAPTYSQNYVEETPTYYSRSSYTQPAPTYYSRTTYAAPVPNGTDNSADIERARIRLGLETERDSNAASSIGALTYGYVPWGGLTILLMFIGFGTVLYVMLNKTK